MMSLLVFTDKHAFGALSLYARGGHCFDADAGHRQALADQLSVVMAAERQIDQLGLALRSRTLIGQAQGVLMARLDIGEDQAFDYLRRVSSCSNRKLVDVAEEIARTRTILGVDPAPPHPTTSSSRQCPARPALTSAPHLRCSVPRRT